MSYRTDLAIEFQKNADEIYENRQKKGEIEVIFHTLEENNQYNKPRGKYATVKTGKIDLLTDFEDAENAIISCLRTLVGKDKNNILVVGLGNNEIISDSVGPFTTKRILATRHIAGSFAEKIGLKNLKGVAVLTPNVLGKTGIEAAETVAAVVKQINPQAVIVIDALCANTVENLFSVIQLTDSGISPGSGVKNARKELSQNTLGVPTVAIGVPTVVEAKTVASELSKTSVEKSLDLVLTPKETDLLCERVSELLASALNVFLQPDIDKEIILSLV